MIHKRTLLRRLAVLGCLAFSLPVYAQFSTPMRDVDDPGRQPLQVMSQNNANPPGLGTPVFLTSLPANATKRLVLDYISLIAENNDISTVQTTGRATVEIRDSTGLIFFHTIVLSVSPMFFGGANAAYASQPIRLYLSAGQTATCTVQNLSSTSTLMVTASLTGHYVALP